jgi:hypothetical protein
MPGIDGMPAKRHAIDVQIRTPDGLIPSRLLQIHWRKISETAVPPEANAAHPRESGGPAAN